MSGAHSFGRYRVTGRLGGGAMGEVHAAVDEVLGREVAVKTLRGHANGLAARILDERFRQEARAIAALSHPAIVQVFDLDLDAEPPFLVMERVAGPSLKDRLEAGPLPASSVRALGIQIAGALAAAHAQKIVHRDVKPANILAAGEGTWKLADFGVAHVPDSSITMTGQFVGSPAYAPPEALVRGQADVEGDVFGLGATLYQAAAGRSPRMEQTSGALLAVPPLAELAPDLPAELAAIIDRAVALEPGDRPTAAELADALARAASVPVAAAPVSLPASSAPVRWQPWAIGAAVLAALVALAVGTGSKKPSAKEASPRSGPIAAPPFVTPTDDPSGPERIEILEPPLPTEKAAKDWRKIVDRIEEGNFSGARRKLWEWERKHGGETPETAALRELLDRLGPDREEEGGGRTRRRRGGDRED